MHATALTLCSLLLVGVESDREWNDSEWRQEDSDVHACRSCEAVFVEEEGNCPSSGFECDIQKSLRSSVLTVDSCHCQSIRCTDRGWRLAVNGNIVDKIACRDKQWMTPQGDAVSSAVCAHSTPPSACQVCKKDLVAYNTASANEKWNVEIVDGKCTQLSATCSGTGHTTAKVNGKIVPFETKVIADCGPDGQQWLYEGEVVKTLDCEPQPLCQSCANADSTNQLIIGKGGTGAFSDQIDWFFDTGCAVQRLYCTGPGPTPVGIQLSGSAGLPYPTGPSPLSFDVTCSADGSKWLYGGLSVIQANCIG